MDLEVQPKRQRTLTKSDYILARTCDAKLYFRERGFPDANAQDPYLQLLAWGGYMVDALAKAKRPAGVRLDYGRDPVTECAHARELLNGDVTLFEATLLHGRRMARADIIERRGGILHLIEVKSKSIDGTAHVDSIRNGGNGLFRNSKRPDTILEDWREKLEDITYQVLLLEKMLPGLAIRPSLVLVDKSKRSNVDNVPKLFRLVTRAGHAGLTSLHSAEFIGTRDELDALDLLFEADVSTEVQLLREEVEEAAARFEAMLDQEFNPEWASHGSKCASCEFRVEEEGVKSGFSVCWGDLAKPRPHVLELFSVGKVMAADGRPLVESLVAAGKASLFDVPEDRLIKKDGTRGPQAERQVRQIECTRRNSEWIGPSLRANIGAVQYPLHFIDFECSRLALPYHAGMRGWGQVAFQWSCHTVAAPSSPPVHREWLNVDDVWPNKAFAVSLRDAIGDAGSILTWSQYESSTLREIISDLPSFEIEDAEMEAWLQRAATERNVDMLRWASNDYYHPGMRGKASIKVVLDALWRSDAAMRDQFEVWTGLIADQDLGPYAALPALEINGIRQDVREGTGAIRAYEAMMYGIERNDTDAKNAWKELLLQYCKLDTMSMMLVFEYWGRLTT